MWIVASELIEQKSEHIKFIVAQCFASQSEKTKSFTTLYRRHSTQLLSPRVTLLSHIVSQTGARILRITNRNNLPVAEFSRRFDIFLLRAAVSASEPCCPSGLMFCVLSCWRINTNKKISRGFCGLFL